MTEPRRPRSQQQVEASQRNGAQSRGPASTAGKAISAQNATKHGLTGSTIDVDQAERVEVRDLQEKLLDRYDMSDPRQEALIWRAISSSLRLARARRLLTEAIEELAMPPHHEGHGDFAAEVSRLISEFGVSAPEEALQALLSQARELARLSAPQSSKSVRLASYVKRFRGERDRALQRLEKLRCGET